MSAMSLLNCQEQVFPGGLSFSERSTCGELPHPGIALTAGTVGLPATVAVFSWAEEILRDEGGAS